MMNQLQTTAMVSRKVIKYGGLSLILMMVGRVMVNIGYQIWKSYHPDPPPPPDVRFGKLPPLQFPKQEKQQFTYTLATPTGDLPTRLPSQANVYFMPVKRPSLLAYDKAQELANSIGFIQEPKKLSSEKYQWQGIIGGLPASLTMNIITGEFVYDRKWQDNIDKFKIATTIMTENQIINVVKTFLGRLQVLADDLQQEQAKISYLKINNTQLVTAPALAQAQFVKVDLFRSPLESLKIMTPYPDKGLVSVLVALQREGQEQMMHVEYNYFPVDRENKASYPLIGVNTAWQRLQAGQAYIARKDVEQQVAIKDVYLAYYDAQQPQQFMQPIYVFEGTKGFLGYVPAVSDEWVGNK